MLKVNFHSFGLAFLFTFFTSLAASGQTVQINPDAAIGPTILRSGWTSKGSQDASTRYRKLAGIIWTWMQISFAFPFHQGLTMRTGLLMLLSMRQSSMRFVRSWQLIVTTLNALTAAPLAF